MIDWFGTRKGISWSYMRVDWNTWEEVGAYDQIVGGSDEESFFTTLKVGGSLDYVGEPPDTTDLVRTYYEFIDDRGEKVRVVVGTMLVEFTATKHGKDSATSGTVNTYSPLKIADDKLFGLPYTVKAGTFAVKEAANLLSSVGLRVSETEKQTKYALSNDHTFKPEDSVLDAVNWLLDAAGYGSAYPDAYGVIVLAPYVNAEKREPVFVFADDENSIMYPQIEDTFDYSDTKNVARLYFEDEYASLWAYAENIDVGSPSSTANNGGREKTLYEEVSEIEPKMPDSPTDQQKNAVISARLQNLINMAEQKLYDNSAQIEYVDIENAFYPLNQGDSVEIRYKDKAWSGTVTNISRDHKTESKCKTKVRRYATGKFTTRKDGGVI